MFMSPKLLLFHANVKHMLFLTLISYYIIKQAVLCYFQYKLSFILF